MNLSLAALILWLTPAFVTCVGSTHSLQRRKYLASNAAFQLTAQEPYFHARSKIDCVRQCRRSSQCTSFAFRKSSGDCYTDPIVTEGADRSLRLYTNQDVAHTCDHRTMPQTNNGKVQVPCRTRPLEAKIACNPDFMGSPLSGNVTIRCTHTGKWLQNGECLQYIFRTPIPRPVREGWSVCLDATPTKDTRFTVNLLTAKGDLPLHSDYRFSYGKSTRVTALNQLQGSEWGTEVSITDFPFVVNQSFTLQITLKTNTTFEIKVNGQVYASFNTTTPSPLQTAVVDVENDVTIQLLNVWCTP